MLQGLATLAALPHAHPVKINAVAIRGFTEEELIPFARLARQQGRKELKHHIGEPGFIQPERTTSAIGG